MSLIAILLTIYYPPEFPELPQGYSEWKEFNKLYCGPDDSVFLRLFSGKRIEPDLNPLPYVLDSNLFNKRNAKGDSICGMSSYYNYVQAEDSYSFQVFLITCWFPHHKINSFDPNPMDPYSGYISYDTLGFEKITIDDREAWRIRGKWWRTYVDGIVHESGFFTNYYIQTERLDYRITCINMTYVHDDYGPDCRGLVHYPDRIAELEQAVEQTFRVKE